MTNSVKIKNIILKSNVTLAPMAGFGDIAFRRLCRDFGAGLTTTEMVSVKGLCYGNEKTEELLRLAPNENPSCVQLFGGEAQYFTKALEKKCLDAFNIIDINMGCPVPKVTKNGEGSALMKDISRAEQIIKATVKAARGRAVTVKFRLGFTNQTINALQFAQMAQSAGADAITLHGRSANMMYSGKADWDIIESVAKEVIIPVFGNGDIFTTEEKLQRLKSVCAGVAIARGALGYPEIFSVCEKTDMLKQVSSGDKTDMLKQISNGDKTDKAARSKSDVLNLIKTHIAYSLEYFPEFVAVRDMRKHLPHYLKGIEGSKIIKSELNFILSASVLLEKLEELLAD